MKRALLVCMSLILLTMSADAKKVAPRRPPKPQRLPPTAAQASNMFAIDLYHNVKDQQGNLIFSPMSISLALGMTMGGAGGQTYTQMAQVFHLERFASIGDVQKGHATLLATLDQLGKTKGTELRLANRLFGQKGFPFTKTFLDATKQSYGAELEQVDFAKKAAKVRTQINKWVEKQTKQRIKNLLPDGSVDAGTRLVLVNAIYLKASWARKFKKSNTYEGAFMLSGGDTVKTQLMSQTGPFKYAELEGLRVLELPYLGSDLAMVFVLPDDLDGLPTLEKILAVAALDRWIAALAPMEKVSVTLPRFTASLDLALAKTLTTMGMPLAFDSGAADFSKLVDATAKERLYISEVFHKAFIQVDEDGAEAAAATAVVMDGDSAQQMPTFSADHPFLYLIRDTKTGVILFMGRIADPRS